MNMTTKHRLSASTRPIRNLLFLPLSLLTAIIFSACNAQAVPVNAPVESTPTSVIETSSEVITSSSSESLSSSSEPTSSISSAEPEATSNESISDNESTSSISSAESTSSMPIRPTDLQSWNSMQKYTTTNEFGTMSNPSLIPYEDITLDNCAAAFPKLPNGACPPYNEITDDMTDAEKNTAIGLNIAGLVPDYSDWDRATDAEREQIRKDQVALQEEQYKLTQQAVRDLEDGSFTWNDYFQ